MGAGASDTIVQSISFRVVVYTSEFDPGLFNAHCLELDVFGQDKTVEGAIAELLQAIEAQFDTAFCSGCQVEFWAPPEVWEKYEQARRASRKVPDELLDRVVEKANRRLGYTSPVKIDRLAGTDEAMEAMERCGAGAD